MVGSKRSTYGCMFPDPAGLTGFYGVVVGARASIFSAESQQWIVVQNPNARVEIFEADEGESHFMCYKNPEKFNALAENFLG